jgi:repressor LexA
VTDVEEYIDLSLSALTPNDYALRVQGDSMIDAHIVEGDLVIMRPVKDPQLVKNGTIVAAYIEGKDKGTTLKHFHRRGNKVTLKPANPKHDPITASAENVTIQGVLVGVWRSP